MSLYFKKKERSNVHTMFVVNAHSNSVIVLSKAAVGVPVWPLSHANQPVFSGLCCLNQGQYGVYACCVCVSVCLSVYMYVSCCETHRAHMIACASRCCVPCALVGGSTGQLREHSC